MTLGASIDALYPLLSNIDSPADLRQLPADQLKSVAAELRQYLIDTVSQMGGHFAAGLGTVELTAARSSRMGCRPSGVSAQSSHQTTRSTRHHQTQNWSGAVSIAQRKRIRHLRCRSLEHVDQCRARHGHRERKVGRRKNG